MSRPVRQCYPIWTTGIPGWISETLRTAGLMLEELRTPRWQAEFRQGEERREFLVLFDSRTAASRDNAAAFLERGCVVLDVAALLKSPRTEDAPEAGPRSVAPRRLRVLERARQQIETAGFLWARVADFPYPFQAALVDDRGQSARRNSDSPPRTLLLPAAAGSRGKLESPSRVNPGEPALGRADIDDLYAQYTAGHALYVPADLTSADAAILDSALDSGRFPLLWRTNSADYANWRRLRREFRFRIDERHRRHEIRYSQFPVHFRPAVELWRGGHFAIVPLQRSRQLVDAGQVVYQIAGSRHPAGLAGLHADLESHSALLTAAARAV